MATNSTSNSKPISMKLILRGVEAGEQPPDLVVIATDRGGKILATAKIKKDGSLELSRDVLKKASRVRVGPAGDAGKDAPSSAFLTYRAADFAIAAKSGVLDISRKTWSRWIVPYRCVNGTVNRCRRSPWWYQALAKSAVSAVLPKFRSTASEGKTIISDKLTPYQRSMLVDLDKLVYWPVRCSPICFGTVEVYRRRCCCKPWVFMDPRLERLLEHLKDLVKVFPEVPDPPIPDPDPGPYRAAFFCNGALDERMLYAKQNLVALQNLPAEQIPTYINARQHLFCFGYSCTPPVKVADGTIGADGNFNICWPDFPRLIPVRCHEEYAYKVKQKIGPFLITIYDGVAAGHWYNQEDEVALKSYHPWAIACRDNGGPGDAFVYLDEIGDTDSSLLCTPDQTSATAVATPAANSGVGFPTGGPDGNGSHDRNWGGTLKLSIMFSESMKTIGAKYYRVSVTEADASGNPSGSPMYVNTCPDWKKGVAVPGGVDVIPVSLGPVSTPAPNAQNSLFEIPYDSDADWEADQYHIHLNTMDARWSDPTNPTDPGAIPPGQATTRYLVTIEIFNSSGERLRPNGTPATGLGGGEVEAAFTFRRKFQETGPTNMVPYGALTHMFWWDNREVVSTIEDLRMDGLAFTEECQFLSGVPASTFGIGYRAYHPWALFQHYHQVWWKRGLSGGSDTLETSNVNIGVPPGPVGSSPTAQFNDMLGNPPPPAAPVRTKCAFSVFVTTYNKRTDGDNLNYSHRTDSAAFALDIET